MEEEMSAGVVVVVYTESLAVLDGTKTMAIDVAASLVRGEGIVN